MLYTQAGKYLHFISAFIIIALFDHLPKMGLNAAT